MTEEDAPPDAAVLLDEVRELVTTWRQHRIESPAVGQLAPIGDALTARLASLDDALTSAVAPLPDAWAQAGAAPPPEHDEDEDEEMTAAAREVDDALAAHRAAADARTAAGTAMNRAGRELAAARIQFRDLARRRDLERP